MKKLYYLIVIILAVNVACSSGKTDNGSDENAAVKIDTFYSADWAFGELRGKVKECILITTDVEMKNGKIDTTDESTVTTLVLKFTPKGYINSTVSNVVFMGENVESSGYTFEYDADGTFQRAYTSNDGILRIQRYPEGYVKTFASITATGESDFVKGYTWEGPLLTNEFIVNSDKDMETRNGKLMPDVSNKTTYTYDDNGYKIKAVEEFGDPEIELIVTETTYDNKKVDSHGNWIERVVTKKASRYEGSFSGRGKLIETNASYLTESRAITYYE